MALIVQKYGGSSVADPDKIKNVAKRVIESKKQGHQVVVVVSALGNTTDELVRLAHRITSRPSERELDMLMATGEQISSALLAMAIQELGYDAISFTGAQVGIVTDSLHTKAKIVEIGDRRIRKALDEDKICIVAGFQGVDVNEDITTLGKGGSDTTAVALAAVLGSKVCEIYTDVEGVYTADPRIVPDARKIGLLSYEEMLELASAGARVLETRSVEFAKKYQVLIHIRSSFSDKEGTRVMGKMSDMEKMMVSGVTSQTDEAKVSILKVPDRPGIAAKLFGAIAAEGIVVDMIIQNISEQGTTDVSFTVLVEDLPKIMEVSKRIASEIGARGVSADEEIAKISVVGVGMRTHSGVAAKMFEALASKGINIEMISTSEIKISCIIRQKDAARAVNVLHREFGLGK